MAKETIFLILCISAMNRNLPILIKLPPVDILNGEKLTKSDGGDNI